MSIDNMVAIAIVVSTVLIPLVVWLTGMPWGDLFYPRSRAVRIVSWAGLLALMVDAFIYLVVRNPKSIWYPPLWFGLFMASIWVNAICGAIRSIRRNNKEPSTSN